MITVVENEKDWGNVLKMVDTYDAYHTYGYHHVSKSNGEKPILVIYEKQGCLIAIPLMLKAIRDTAHNDATSAYGYCGPISSNIGPDFNSRDFAHDLKNFLSEKAVASVFSRLNPFIPNQGVILKHSGTIEALGQLINIDLTKSLESQRKVYNPRLKTYINKCRKNYLIKDAGSEAEIKELVSIYYENMLRVNAKDQYFFPGSYFLNLWKSTDFNTKFLLAYDKVSNDLAGGAIFTMTNDIVQYHLSGARKEYLRLNPIKVLIDDMRIKATDKGFKYFNLGGGVGNNQDSLFRFKSGYSKDFKSFKIWKYIVDQQVYDELVTNRNIRCGYNSKSCQKFFPCYRCAFPR
ncbi:GNAT family N-acetyltransferase [Flagellimonas lutaonensis]|uniref:BioF2-like acetyltransferase domain-containing protein n=1 Tax=Flagellimonas lutaonensis TaxID=516051 RepID=A0A0D5YV18_9FLAO|nr:GNAT family N-acetyltransferase [Allomuricauda lutaonensis]AKA36065.1 hypothetical protein VC82_2490 [Allomuricauda lutaonensis]